MANGGGITHAAPTPGQMTRIRQQQARAASYGQYNYQPNVAAITMEDVGRRCLVPTRCLTWSFDSSLIVAPPLPPGTDVVAAIIAQVAPNGFPQPFWDLQLAADREEIFGDSIVAICVSIQCQLQHVDAAGLWTDVTSLQDSLEQQLYQAFSLAVFPTSGVRSPIIFDTELRAFAPTHRLSGADGYTAIPVTPMGDQFSTISLVQSPVPVATTGPGTPFPFIPLYNMVLEGGAASQWSTSGTISCALKKVRGTT